MARNGVGNTVVKKNGAGEFFLATLLLWLVSVVFEIAFNLRTELLWVICGGCFFQLMNWVVRSWISRDPLFVNTSVSLLHSIITSASGHSLLSMSLLMGTLVNFVLNFSLNTLFIAQCSSYFWLNFCLDFLISGMVAVSMLFLVIT